MTERARPRPLVSCVVPVHNGERHITFAIRSVLAQTHRPIEILVVDDGSADSTRERASAFGDEVRVLVQENQGPAAARNHAIRESRGDLIAFHDADDLWHPEKLERQIVRFEARPELGCSITLMRSFWDEGHDEAERHYRDHRRMQPVPGYAATPLVVRRSVFEEIGELDAGRHFSDIIDFFLRVREHGIEVELLPEVLSHRRLHSANMSRRRSKACEDEFVNLAKASLDRRRNPSRA